MSATVILDPVEVASPGRTELGLTGDLTEGGIEIYWQGLDFGDQEVKSFLAEGVFGSTPIDHIWPLIPVKIPLIIRATEAKSFDDWRVALQQKVAQINQEGGGRLKRVLKSGRHGFADITEAKLHFSASWLAENKDIDREATLELQRLPDWYGDEITGTAHEFTGDGAFTMLVDGDMPARVTNMQVEDKSGNNQQGLMWHYRRRNYSSANTAEWAYNAEALGLLDIAEKVTLEGSYGTKVVKHPKLSTGWTPVLSTNKAGTTFLTHTGLYSVWARVYAPYEGLELPWLRLLYGVGDIVAPQENAQVQVPAWEALYWVCVGQVNISALPFGAQRWEGVIQARGEAGGENISIDRLRFVCGDESSGALAALKSSASLNSTIAADSLTGMGALSGSEALRGGKWEESGSTKGGYERTGEGASRKATEDTEGRTAVLSGSTMGSGIIKAEFDMGLAKSGAVQAVYLRYFSSTYWVRVGFKLIALGHPAFLYRSPFVQWCVGGVEEAEAFGAQRVTGSSIGLEVRIDDDAEVTMRFAAESEYSQSLPSTFKKGETHAKGKIGIYDYNPGEAATRTYRDLVVSSLPLADAVMYANKSAFLSTMGMYRESVDGAGAAPIGYPGADLPRLPVSGPEEAPVEIAVAPSRGQYGEAADSGKDKFKVQVGHRPCFAEIPEN